MKLCLKFQVKALKKVTGKYNGPFYLIFVTITLDTGLLLTTHHDVFVFIGMDIMLNLTVNDLCLSTGSWDELCRGDVDRQISRH